MSENEARNFTVTKMPVDMYEWLEKKAGEAGVSVSPYIKMHFAMEMEFESVGTDNVKVVE